MEEVKDKDAKRYTDEHVRNGEPEQAITQQLEILVAEGTERAEASTKADGQKRLPLFTTRLLHVHAQYQPCEERSGKYVAR